MASLEAVFFILAIPSDSGGPPSVQVWAVPATGRAETALFPRDCTDTSPSPTSLLSRLLLLSSRLLSGRQGQHCDPPHFGPEHPPRQMAVRPQRRYSPAARDAAQERMTVPAAVSCLLSRRRLRRNWLGRLLYGRPSGLLRPELSPSFSRGLDNVPPTFGTQPALLRRGLLLGLLEGCPPLPLGGGNALPTGGTDGAFGLGHCTDRSRTCFRLADAQQGADGGDPFLGFEALLFQAFQGSLKHGGIQQRFPGHR
jgi:hypothetical protein